MTQCRVHAPASSVEQERAEVAVGDRPVDAAPDRGRQWNQHDPGAFADHAQDSVAVFFADIGDVGVAGFEDPEPKHVEHHDQREVERVGRVSCRREQHFEL
ncbi:hypothetical protein [Nocardia brasiliensis]|uniref:hypothetical protein n=1 Tax=Nocardia brasiliensis TaxID=37326 RepID=UPI002458C40B|nr:hypothetical protein [Nocardia brasiliensis]